MDRLRQIEDIIHTDPGQRGLQFIWNELRDAKDERLYQIEKACSLLSVAKSVLVLTGFYILRAKTAETDGPPGALAICRALVKLGKEVTLVADQFVGPCLQAMIRAESETNPSINKVAVVEFPLGDLAAATKYGQELLAAREVDCLVSIECPSSARDGTYRNMRGLDISEFTPRRDVLFQIASQTKAQSMIGIGDGGNEIGMGNLRTLVEKFVPSGADICASVGCDAIISTGVSNWGGYALAVALAVWAKAEPQLAQSMMPNIVLEQRLMEVMCGSGIVDGTQGAVAQSVDGIPFKDHALMLEKILKAAS